MAVQTGDFKVIGTSPVRHDGVDKVTGRAQYGADVALPGTLYGKVLRSPHAHARVLSIDTSGAEELPGVFAVVTSDDMPEPAEARPAVAKAESSKTSRTRAPTCSPVTRSFTAGTRSRL